MLKYNPTGNLNDMDIKVQTSFCKITVAPLAPAWNRINTIKLNQPPNVLK